MKYWSDLYPRKCNTQGRQNLKNNNNKYLPQEKNKVWTMSVDQAYKGKSVISTRCEIICLMIGLTEEQNGYSHRADGFKSGTLILKGGRRNEH